MSKLQTTADVQWKGMWMAVIDLRSAQDNKRGVNRWEIKKRGMWEEQSLWSSCWWKRSGKQCLNGDVWWLQTIPPASEQKNWSLPSLGKEELETKWLKSSHPGKTVFQMFLSFPRAKPQPFSQPLYHTVVGPAPPHPTTMTGSIPWAEHCPCLSLLWVIKCVLDQGKADSILVVNVFMWRAVNLPWVEKGTQNLHLLPLCHPSCSLSLSPECPKDALPRQDGFFLSQMSWAALAVLQLKHPCCIHTAC